MSKNFPEIRLETKFQPFPLRNDRYLREQLEICESNLRFHVTVWVLWNLYHWHLFNVYWSIFELCHTQELLLRLHWVLTASALNTRNCKTFICAALTFAIKKRSSVTLLCFLSMHISYVLAFATFVLKWNSRCSMYMTEIKLQKWLIKCTNFLNHYF